MLKEKIEKWLKGGDSKKKIESLVFFLILLIITVLAINFIWKEEDTKKMDEKNSGKRLATTVLEQEKEYDTLETKLADILSNISGVGKVKVLLTYKETEELIPLYNQNDKSSKTNETDSSGGTRVIEETDNQKEIVFENERIVTQKKKSPQIEGAVITAEGANNPTIKTSIIQAVEAATGLATHKIQVFEKQN